jgi:hypothetical protein
MASMAVRMPTSAMIPNAMINMVRIVLSIFVRIDFRAIRTFSKNIAIFIRIGINETLKI